MLFNIILVGAVLFSTATFARGINGSCDYYDPLPKQYDYPYKGPMNIIVDKKLKHCGLSWFDQNGVCQIRVHPDAKEKNTRHEMAHCNGWDTHYVK